jgi:hypothetical protein
MKKGSLKLSFKKNTIAIYKSTLVNKPNHLNANYTHDRMKYIKITTHKSFLFSPKAEDS